MSRERMLLTANVPAAAAGTTIAGIGIWTLVRWAAGTALVGAGAGAAITQANNEKKRAVEQAEEKARAAAIRQREADLRESEAKLDQQEAALDKQEAALDRQQEHIGDLLNRAGGQEQFFFIAGALAVLLIAGLIAYAVNQNRKIAELRGAY